MSTYILNKVSYTGDEWIILWCGRQIGGQTVFGEGQRQHGIVCYLCEGVHVQGTAVSCLNGDTVVYNFQISEITKAGYDL